MRLCPITHYSRSSEGNLSNTGITQGNLGRKLPPNPLESHQNGKIKSFNDHAFSFSFVTLEMKMRMRLSAPPHQLSPTDDHLRTLK